MMAMTKHERNIGHVIKLLRTVSGLKQKDLALGAGINANYLSLVEAGKREPSLAVLRALAKELNVPTSLLLWESESISEMSSAKEEDSILKLKRLVLEMEALRLANQKRMG